MNLALSETPKTGFVAPQNPYEPRHDISNNVVCATSKGSDQPAHTRSLIRAFARGLKYSMTVKLLTEQHLEFLSLKGGCTGSSESTLVKIPHCWKSHVAAHITIKQQMAGYTKHIRGSDNTSELKSYYNSYGVLFKIS